MKKNNVIPMQKGRSQWIDIAKGIGILLMIFGHMGIGDPKRIFIYSFHMPMFVLISGYLYRDRKKGYLELVKRKSKSLLVPYFWTNVGAYFFRLALLIYMGAFTLAGALGVAKAQALSFLGGSSFYVKHFINIGTSGPIWFVTFLFCVTIIYPLIAKLPIWNGKIKDIVILALLVGLCYLGRFYSIKNGFLPWNLDVVPVGLVFYHCGVMCMRYDVFEKLNWFVWVLLLGFWLATYWREGTVLLATREYLGFPFSLTISVAASICVLWLVKKLSSRKPFRFCNVFFAWVGRSGMMILALHTIEFVHLDWLTSMQGKVGNVYIAYLIYMAVILTGTICLQQLLRLGHNVLTKIRMTQKGVSA